MPPPDEAAWRFVPTDAAGVQRFPDHERVWPLPGDSAPGAVAHVRPGEHELVLLDADGLLDQLGERIFLAEEVPAEAGARLVRELPWGLEATADFALDCAEHALEALGDAGAAGLSLPDGTAVAEVLVEARRFLRSAEAGGDRRLGWLSRLALARRLGKEQDEVAGLATAEIVTDEAADLDALDDPRWGNLAAISSALLACTEVLRHLALPRYVAARERTFGLDGAQPDPGQAVVTPWGPVGIASHLPEYVPAYVSAREAAERARTAVADHAGTAAGEAERAAQRRRLLELLQLA